MHVALHGSLPSRDLGCFQQVSHHVAHAEKQSRCASRGYCSTIQQDADAARKKGVGPRHTAYSLVLSPHRILSLLASSTRTQPRPLAGGKSRLFCEAASASRWNGPFLIAMQVVGHGADLIRFTHAQPRPAGNSLIHAQASIQPQQLDTITAFFFLSTRRHVLATGP